MNQSEEEGEEEEQEEQGVVLDVKVGQRS